MSWNKITIKQHEAIQQAMLMESNQKWIIVASIIEGIPEEEVSKWDWPTKMIPYIEWLKWMEHPPEKLIKEFEVQGVKYKLIDLESKLETGRFIAGLEHKDTSWRGVAEKCAIICHPVLDEEFTTAKHKALAEHFYNHLTMDIVRPLSTFFLLFYMELYKSTQSYLEAQIRETLKTIQADISQINS